MANDMPSGNRMDGRERETQRWARRRDVIITTLGVLIIAALLIWAMAHVAHALLVVLVAALLAYALLPAVTLLSHHVPRWLAILLVYLGVVSVTGAVGYLIVTTAVDQVMALSHQVTVLLSPSSTVNNTPLLRQLQRLGVTQAQIRGLGDQVLAQARIVLDSALPVLSGIFNGVLDLILVTVLSIYLLVDGKRAIQFTRTAVPIKHRARVTFTLTTFERVVGGYIRGQLVLATLIGLLVGLGMMVLNVPYAVLLGIIAFIMEFIPILGVFISGALCVLVALTQGWFLAVLVLVYFVLIHIIEGDVVGPRIVGSAVGVHPAVSIFALLAGAELFGIWGALFASPIAGLVQAFLSEVWREWREFHPQQYPEEFGAAMVPVTTGQALKTSAPLDSSATQAMGPGQAPAEPQSQPEETQTYQQNHGSFAVHGRGVDMSDQDYHSPDDSGSTQALEGQRHPLPAP